MTLERLRTQIAEAFPSTLMSIDAPLRADGIWSLDINHSLISVCVDWNPSTGAYGITKPEPDGCRLGGDEILPTFEEASKRVFYILQNGW